MNDAKINSIATLGGILMFVIIGSLNAILYRDIKEIYYLSLIFASISYFIIKDIIKNVYTFFMENE